MINWSPSWSPPQWKVPKMSRIITKCYPFLCVVDVDIFENLKCAVWNNGSHWWNEKLRRSSILQTDLIYFRISFLVKKHQFILLVCIIFLALKNPKAKSKEFRLDEKRISKLAYFLSPEYYTDIYKINNDFTKNLLKWQCLSKLKLTSFENFYQTLLLLSGDIALNPGPASYPCSKCSKGVGAGSVLCTHCDMWIHSKCEGISNTALKSLSDNPILRSHFVGP